MNLQDEHLRAALRHAPDASVAPPEALSQRILAAARQGVPTPAPRTRPSPRWAPQLAEWLSALARPPFAGAMAGVMVAVLGGWIWWGQPVDIAQAPAEEVAVAPAPAPSPHPTPHPAPVAVPTPSAEAPRSAATAPPAAKAQKPSRPPAAEAPRPAPEPRRDTAVATAPAQDMAPAAPPAVTADAAKESRKAEAAPPRQEPPAMAAAPAPARAAENQTAGASARARFAAPEPTMARFAPLLQQLAAEPGRWQGRVRAPADNTARTLDVAALSALLRDLQTVVGDVWLPTTDRAAEPALAELQLHPGGPAAHQVRLHADRIEWQAGRALGVIRLSPEGVAAALRAFQ